MRVISILFFSICCSIYLTGQQKHFYVLAEMDGVLMLSDSTNTNYWGFGTFNPAGGPHKIEYPSPTLEVNQGDTVHIHFYNESNEDHTIHLHGLDVDQANDGVPTTSQAIDPNDSTIYSFVAYNAGSFIYHCHVATPLHVAMGMYGMITVLNSPEANLIYSGGPSFNKSYDFLSSDFDLSWNFNILTIGPFHLYEADYFMVNGLSGMLLYGNTDNIIEMQAGDSVLLRIGNMGYTIAKYIFPSEVNAVAYTSDGRILPSPMSGDTLIVYPSERYGVLLTPSTFVSDWVTVENVSIKDHSILETNYIGINKYNHPNDIYEIESVFINLFPNPTDGNLQIHSNNAMYYRMVNMNGETVKNGMLNEGVSIIHCFDLSSGMYLLHLPGLTTKKIIIK